MRIAIADDDGDSLAFLENVVTSLGHVSAKFADGERLSAALLRDTFDLVMLDWNMPGKSGFEVLQWMQSTIDNPPPVVMLTARTAKRDVTDALNAGADDYICKPEDEEVIAARIAAVLRRSNGSSSMDKIAEYGNYRLDRMAQTIRHNGADIVLTAKEFELADLLFRNRDRTLSRAYIMETIWRTSADLATRTLDMHISRVRSKLSLKPENGFRIFTVFGYGYRLETIDPAKDPAATE
ncbi:DNA-binding response OmpR family regulator [Blastomonas natatoria]|uniref:DNA-binding response OmpR family regulator n=1 Tax=Blastomonas natatoria TaxID=34015 RepID=A0A2V3UYM6_9SPHN|nr:response regulator transcription factor [Blastomonas natatoria]PXW74513.1 DNA-binding response OmpR family regulator [Blastomonas natatoria]